MSEDAEARASWVGQVPNLLSGLRLVLAFAFPFAPASWRLLVIVTAAVTDGLDGYFARKWKVESAAGGLLDAIADKTFALSVIVVLAVDGKISWWQILLVLSRDFVVAVAALYFALQRRWDAFREMPSRPAGKVATAFVFVWFVTLVTPGVEALQPAAFALTAAASVAAAVDYVVKFGRALAEHPA